MSTATSLSSCVEERPTVPLGPPLSFLCSAGGPACRGRTELFFAPRSERREAREHREVEARALCLACPVLEPCRAWAREKREYGFWGGESEEERAAAGYRARLPVGQMAGVTRTRVRVEVRVAASLDDIYRRLRRISAHGG